MRCLIRICHREASRWWRIQDRDGRPFLTASCGTCAVVVRTSVLDANGVSAVEEIGRGEFLAREVVDEEPIMKAILEVGNGRVIYGPV